MSMRRTPRVAIVATSLDVLGGQGVQARSLVEALDSDGRPVTFLPINPAFPAGLGWLRRVRYLRTLANQALYLPGLARLAAADVAHVFSASYMSFLLAPLPAMAAARMLKKRVVLHYHSGEADDHLTNWGALVHPWLRLADEIVVPSRYLADVFARHGYRARVIPNVVDLSRFTFRCRQPLRPHLLSTRNLERYYRVDVILEAFRILKARRSDATLTVAGSGSESGRLRAMASEGVRFVGAVEPASMPALCDSADIFLNASEVDNQPVSILEAFASGLAVVSTPTGDIRTMVRPGETGLIVAPGDPASMAAAVLSLLDDPSRAASLSARARESVAHYTWPAVRGEWDAVYQGDGAAEPCPARAGFARQLARVRRMPASEVAGRLRQECAKLRDRLATPPSSSPSAVLQRHAPALANPDVAIDWLRRIAPARFFAGAAAAATSDVISDRFADHAGAVVAEAERLLGQRFDLLGYRQLSFGVPIDWYLDPVHGRRAPFVHWSRIDPLDAGTCGDSKVIWELNRHQWMVRLAQAYALSREERYAGAIVTHVDAWLDRNPPQRGINWASSLEVAFRLMSWCWTLLLIRDSRHMSGGWLTRVLASVWQHAEHIRRYLSRYFSPNTHLTGEALGLFYAGTLFTEFDRAARWRASGERILLDESRRQITGDGLHFEQATCYHLYTVEIYLQFLLLSTRAASTTVRPELAARTELMVDAMLSLRQPDGRLPAIGDDDGGSLLPLTRRERGDARGACAVAAALFRNPDFAWAAGGPAPELGWLIGPDGVSAFDAIAPAPPAKSSSHVLPSSGYAVLRSGWESDAHQLIVDIGPLGCPVSGAHGHADLLSVQCVVGGQPILVDAGTGAYTGAPEWREHFRSTAAHSTLIVDGRSQAGTDGPFGWTDRPAARLRAWQTTATAGMVDAEHDAYGTVAGPIRHRRRVIFVTPFYWVIVDDVAGAGRHDVTLQFQCAPIDAALVGEGWARASAPGGPSLWIAPRSSTPLSLSIACGEAQPLRGWVSADYGRCEPAPLIAAAATVDLPWRALTVLVPESTASDQLPRLWTEVSDDAWTGVVFPAPIPSTRLVGDDVQVGVS
jgi:glycosyltransferase involved in cell wall biosynthesis